VAGSFEAACHGGTRLLPTAYRARHTIRPPATEEEMSMSKLLYEKRNRIARLTINRPEARNAIDPDVHRLMVEAWADFRDDDSVDVAILTGTGDAFCAGADLKTYIPPIIEEGSAARLRQIVELGLNGFTRGMHRIYKPIIGAINGWALAGGLETAMACDIRIASERAMFGSFEARRGFHHGDGGLVRLVNTCGVGVAMQMLLTAEPIDARRALECNMVTRVVPHERLIEEAELVAQQILRNSQAAVRSAKQTIIDVIGQPLDFQLRTEAWNAYTCADPEETKELLERFYEKTDAGRAGSHTTEL
jgi:enoyl-CoA hydratase/carnithine racemase